VASKELEDVAADRLPAGPEFLCKNAVASGNKWHTNGGGYCHHAHFARVTLAVDSKVRCYPSFVPPRIAIKIDINISHMDISHIRTVASCARALVEQCDDLCAD